MTVSGRPYAELTTLELEELVRQRSLSATERAEVEEAYTQRRAEELLALARGQSVPTPAPAPVPMPSPKSIANWPPRNAGPSPAAASPPAVPGAAAKEAPSVSPRAPTASPNPSERPVPEVEAAPAEVPPPVTVPRGSRWRGTLFLILGVLLALTIELFAFGTRGFSQTRVILIVSLLIGTLVLSPLGLWAVSKDRTSGKVMARIAFAILAITLVHLVTR